MKWPKEIKNEKGNEEQMEDKKRRERTEGESREKEGERREKWS